MNELRCVNLRLNKEDHTKLRVLAMFLGEGTLADTVRQLIRRHPMPVDSEFTEGLVELVNQHTEAWNGDAAGTAAHYLLPPR